MFHKTFWCFSTSLLVGICLIINCPTVLADQSNPAASVINNQVQVTQPSTISTSSTNGLVTQNNVTRYYQNGVPQTGWQHVNGNWYYFNDNGNGRQGWQSINNRWYYFNPQTSSAETGEQQINHNWYDFDQQNAWANTGWQYVNNSWHYYDPQNAWAKTGWYQSGAGNWYYFNQSTSKALTGEKFINGHHYYFDPHNAWAIRGWQYLNQRWRYFDPTNAWADTGWQFINGHWYYFDLNSANTLSGWQHINNRWYYFDPTNAWALSQWFQSPAGNWYYFDPQNAWADAGWQFINGTWYYFDPNNAWMDLNQTLNYNWQQIMGRYWNSSAIAIQLQRNGSVYSTTNNPGYRYETASTVKVAILAMLLHQTGGNLNATQRDLVTRMILYSDNDATDKIVTDYLGGTGNLRSLTNYLGMSQTTVPIRHWAAIPTVPVDQLKLLHMIFLDNNNDYLNIQSKNYIKSLMASISADQRWGISAGSRTYYLKNGWRTAPDNGLWEVHSIGYLPDGINSYTIAIYTRNNRNYRWGVSYVEALARITKKIIG